MAMICNHLTHTNLDSLKATKTLSIILKSKEDMILSLTIPQMVTQEQSMNISHTDDEAEQLSFLYFINFLSQIY